MAFHGEGSDAGAPDDLPYARRVAAHFGVDLRIIDASGRSVRAMSGTADGTGVLRLRWDGKDSAGRAAGSGLFFVTATTAEGHASSKLVVLD